jgi:hypothetical protein
MSHLALELLHPLDLWPFVVIQDACAMQKQVAGIFKQPGRAVGFCLLELDEPLALVLVPVTADDFGVERHVFPQTPDFADLVQVLPDIRCIGEEPWPVGLSCSQ